MPNRNVSGMTPPASSPTSTSATSSPSTPFEAPAVIAASILLPAQGAALVQRVFESWAFWAGNDRASKGKECPGCSMTRKSGEHKPDCWFKQASDWLASQGLSHPPVHDE